MSDAQQVRRAVERFQRGRRWEHSAFPTSSGGLLHTPYPRQGAGQARTAGGGGDITIGQAPIGELARCHVHGHLSPGGEPIVWDSFQHRVGFGSAIVPNVELRLPHTAVYGIEGDLSWTDGFVFGGRISLLLNGIGIPGLSPIRAGGAVDNAVGRTFTLAQEFIANEGDRLMLMVNHAGDSHHDIEGVIEVATKEPLRLALAGGGDAGPAFLVGAGGSNTNSLSINPDSELEVGDTMVAVMRSGITSGSQYNGPVDADWDVVWALYNPPDNDWQAFYQRTATAKDVAGPIDWMSQGFIGQIAVAIVGVKGPVTRHDFVLSSLGASTSLPSYTPPAAAATIVNLVAAGTHAVTDITGTFYGWWEAVSTGRAVAAGSQSQPAEGSDPGGVITQAASASTRRARFIFV